MAQKAHSTHCWYERLHVRIRDSRHALVEKKKLLVSAVILNVYFWEEWGYLKREKERNPTEVGE